VIDELAITSEPAGRRALNHVAETIIAEDFVNGYLFQLAKTGVANAKIEGLWANAPTQANDLTAVHWVE
jgi:peptide/nickel transport system substrate-binding protein